LPRRGGRGRQSESVTAPARLEGVLTEQEMTAFQKDNVLAALKKTGWKVSGKGGAAELLGVRPTTLAHRIRTLGIKKPL
jgi:transcriptional regulator with GAF, ATPase, and Fis domain